MQLARDICVLVAGAGGVGAIITFIISMSSKEPLVRTMIGGAVMFVGGSVAAGCLSLAM